MRNQIPQVALALLALSTPELFSIQVKP